MPADGLIIIPTTLFKGSWMEELEEELLIRGIIGRVKERTGWQKIDKYLIYDIIHWRCWWNGANICPAIAFEGEKAYLLMLDVNADKYIRVLDFENVMIEEIQGLIRYSECLEKYGYDFPC